MADGNTAPRLSLAHATIQAPKFDATVAFYRDVLGFHVTNSGEVPGGTRMAFVSQDPDNHHQIAVVETAEAPPHGFVLADHLAFRTAALDDLRVLRGRLDDAGVDPVIPICHGNAWSLYFNDPDGNGVEVFVDTPFHVAQPFANGLDLDQSDEHITEATRAMIESEPEFQSMAEWRAAFEARLG
jgi:catechol-2,3-dioxygenase